MGDAPLGYGRWRFESGPAGQGLQFAMVDRLCVLKEYRRRGFAKACLEKIVQDVSTQVEEVCGGEEGCYWLSVPDLLMLVRCCQIDS